MSPKAPLPPKRSLGWQKDTGFPLPPANPPCLRTVFGVSLSKHWYKLQVATAVRLEHGAGNTHRMWVFHSAFWCNLSINRLLSSTQKSGMAMQRNSCSIVPTAFYEKCIDEMFKVAHIEQSHYTQTVIKMCILSLPLSTHIIRDTAFYCRVMCILLLSHLQCILV